MVGSIYLASGYITAYRLMSLSFEVSKFIEKEELFLDSQPLLCAVSGGIDSMVMMDILRTLGYPLEIAHINYMLRGDDSMLDEALVAQYSELHNLSCHIYKLRDKEVRELKSGNLQDKARDIRYNWFSQVNTYNPLRPVCTAHHQGDVAETFILHALRGSGSKGLGSLRAKSSIYRRPLLNVDRQQIKTYAKDHNVPFRQDQSNLDSVYDRNFIRNEIIPPLSKRWPEAISKFSDASANISKDNDLLLHLVKETAKKWCQEDEQYIMIGPLKDLREQPHVSTLLFHMLQTYNFSENMISSIVNKNTEAGAVFKTPTHEATINQDQLIIKKNLLSAVQLSVETRIDAPGIVNTTHGVIEIIKINKENRSKVKTNPWSEIIDSAKVSWPLTVRTWKKSDRISPLGMNGKQKKVSDILIDQKANRFEKEKQLVLTDKTEEIIWVVGRKLSDHYKYSEETTQFLKFKFTKQV